jgi:hypothetical protein
MSDDYTDRRCHRQPSAQARISHQHPGNRRNSPPPGRRCGTKDPLEAQGPGAAGDATAREREITSQASLHRWNPLRGATLRGATLRGSPDEGTAGTQGGTRSGSATPLRPSQPYSRRYHVSEQAAPGMGRVSLPTAARSHLLLPRQRLLRCSAADFPVGVPRHVYIPVLRKPRRAGNRWNRDSTAPGAGCTPETL